MPRIPTVSSLRFRAAYGTSGVQPSSIAALPTVLLGNALVGGSTVSAARQLALGNPKLGPERQTEFETGFDFEIDSGRANLEVTYYNRESREALINRPLAPSVGVPALPPVGSNPAVATRLENLGRVRNHGYEASLAARLLSGARISVDMTLNGSVTYNKLVSLGPNVSSIPSSKSWRQQPGYPLFGAWDRPILGFSDRDGNGIITGDEVVMGPVEIYRAPTTPTQQLTAGSTARLFGDRVDLNVLFDWRGGYEHATYEQINKCNFTASSCLGVISIETPLAEQVRYAAMRTYNSWWGYFQDGSFLRWRELGVTIQAPRNFTRYARAQSMSLTLTGRNLRLWTSYTGVDPEVNSNAGRDDNSSNPTAPPSRYWIARINIGY
jgi:hypothetical protein